MIRRSTWVLLIIFAVILLGAVIWQSTIGQQNGSGEPTATIKPVEMLFNLPEDAVITQVIIENQDGNRIVFGRDAEDSPWQIIEPDPSGDVDSEAIQNAIDRLSRTTVDLTIETFADLSPYGLDIPQYKISIILADGAQHDILVGSMTVTQDRYYLMLDGGNPKVVSKFAIEDLINMLDTPPILPTPTPTQVPTELGTPSPETTSTGDE